MKAFHQQKSSAFGTSVLFLVIILVAVLVKTFFVDSSLFVQDKAQIQTAQTAQSQGICVNSAYC